ncbi:MAG: hypothetical protein IT372_16220 [Polyangiaceae bacterium]|nr:hypothetical protein [Polyangiaceae bacterium]
MFTVERRVGRLVEVRVQSIRTRADAELFMREVMACVSRTPTRSILCADHRSVPIYPRDVVNQLIALFASVNPHVDRAGILIAPSNATFSMQIERILREAQSPHRRMFYDPDQMVAWLAEILTEAEAVRMRTFLSKQRGGWPGRG